MQWFNSKGEIRKRVRLIGIAQKYKAVLVQDNKGVTEYAYGLIGRRKRSGEIEIDMITPQRIEENNRFLYAIYEKSERFIAEIFKKGDARFEGTELQDTLYSFFFIINEDEALILIAVNDYEKEEYKKVFTQYDIYEVKSFWDFVNVFTCLVPDSREYFERFYEDWSVKNNV